MTILVVEGAAKISKKEGSIMVSDSEGNKVEASVPDLELVVVVGERVLTTSSALLTLLSNGIPVVFISGKLDTYGVLYDVVQVGTINIREAQYRCFIDEYCKVMYSKPIIYSKIRGLYNILRYEHKYYKDLMRDYEDVKLKILEVLESIEKARGVDELRTLEAVGSKYFWNIAVNLVQQEYGFTGREPRRGDVINSSIDFLYAVLYGIVTKAIVAAGLDPFCGLIHVSKSGRVSLTYDLSEIFKPIAIHAVLQASRKARLKNLRGSRMLTPKTIEILVKHLYSRLARERDRTTGGTITRIESTKRIQQASTRERENPQKKINMGSTNKGGRKTQERDTQEIHLRAVHLRPDIRHLMGFDGFSGATA